MVRITTCPKCLSSSNHNDDVKVCFCFFCGFKIPILSRSLPKFPSSKGEYEKLMGTLDELNKEIFYGIKMEKIIDWNKELKEEIERQNRLNVENTKRGNGD